MVASFEVADSVRLGPSELQMHFFFKANQVMRTGVGLFFRCCPMFVMFVLVVFFSLLRSLVRLYRVADAGAKLAFFCKCPES